MVEDNMTFKIKGVEFKQVGIKRDDSGSFNLIFLKNCNTNSYKWIQRSKLEKILKNNYI